MAKDTSLRQSEFIAQYIGNRGNVSAACEAMMPPLAPSTYYAWRKDPKFRKKLKGACKVMEEALFSQVYQYGMDGDITAAIFSLKALNRKRYDDAFARQVYALKKGVLPNDAIAVPVKVTLVRDDVPERLRGETSVNGSIHVEN